MSNRKKQLSPAQILKSNLPMVYQLGKLKRKYNGGLDQGTVKNFYENRFIFHMYNSRCLDFKVKKEWLMRNYLQAVINS